MTPKNCPYCGGKARLYTDCPRPVAYCRNICIESDRWPRQYRATPAEAVKAWNAQVREIQFLNAQ